MHDQDNRFTVPGFRVGHWTHPTRATGCTVIIADEPVLAVVDVRGGAPGTRETALLQEGRLVQHLDAVLLTGGSAFGLAAADGVMRWLREQGRGFPTSSIPVPIVSAAVIFDLQGSDPVIPDSESGYAAASGAVENSWISGAIGVGTGATVGKIANPQGLQSGIGAARLSVGAGSVAALLAVNAVGDIATPDEPGKQSAEDLLLSTDASNLRPGENTTIGVVIVNAAVSRDDLVRIGIAAHDGLARAIHPAHTPFDGDTIFVLGRSEGRLAPHAALQLAVATQHVVMRAVQKAARSSIS